MAKSSCIRRYAHIVYWIPKWWRHKNFFFFLFPFQRFKYHISVKHDEKPPQFKFGGNRFMRAWIMAAWIRNKPQWNQCIGLVHNCYEPGQFTLLSMGLITYSCGHISGPHKPIHVKFGVWGFFIEIWSWKCLNAKSNFWWRHTSLLYCLLLLLMGYYTNINERNIKKKKTKTKNPFDIYESILAQLYLSYLKSSGFRIFKYKHNIHIYTIRFAKPLCKISNPLKRCNIQPFFPLFFQTWN